MSERAEEIRINGSGDGKHMFIPGMCPIGARIACGVFRNLGYKAEVPENTDRTLALGYKYTSGGECVPCPCTTGACISAIQDQKLDPSKVVLFMPTACGPCRFGQYARLDKIIFDKLGWDGIQILSPSAENSYGGIEEGARKNIFRALISADIIRKIGMKLRPYEVNKGEVDAYLENWIQRFEAEFEKDSPNAKKLLSEMCDEGAAIKLKNEKRPLVGVVGEIYVRSDPFINQNVCRRIEELGGEAWLAPLSEWILYTSECTRRVAKENRDGFAKRLKMWIEGHWFHNVEASLYKAADRLMHDRHEPHVPEIMAEGEKFLPWQFEGEAVLTLGRASLFKKLNGASAVVNASPAFCMPGTITTSIFPTLEKEINIPIICNFYDGSGDPNQSLVPYMHYLREQFAGAAATA